MWPDRVSNPGPLTYESGALPTALRGPAPLVGSVVDNTLDHQSSDRKIDPSLFWSFR